MEGSARAFDRRWRATVTWSDRRDGGVREQMEVDFGLGLILGLRKTKEKFRTGKKSPGLRPRF